MSRHTFIAACILSLVAHAAALELQPRAILSRRAAVGLLPALPLLAQRATAKEAPPTLRQIQVEKQDEAALNTPLSVAELVANTRKDKEAMMGRPMTEEEVKALEEKIRDLYDRPEGK